MVKRYEGNTGRVEILGGSEPPLAPGVTTPPDTPMRAQPPPDAPMPAQPPPTAPAASAGRAHASPGPLGELGKLLPEKLLQPLRELEAGDLLMIAVLYLLYRESGDTELLLILGAMLFL